MKSFRVIICNILFASMVLVSCTNTNQRKKLSYKVHFSSDSFLVNYELIRTRGELTIYGKTFIDKSTMPDSLYILNNESLIMMNGIEFNKKTGIDCDTFFEDDMPFRVCSNDTNLNENNVREYIVHYSDLMIDDVGDLRISFQFDSEDIVPYRIENIGSRTFTVQLIRDSN